MKIISDANEEQHWKYPLKNYKRRESFGSNVEVLIWDTNDNLNSCWDLPFRWFVKFLF